jgi:cardiolipin synthase
VSVPSRRGLWTVPNFITLVRLAVLPAFLYCISSGRFGLALAWFVVAGVSDGLDGYFARRLDMKSAFGAVLDPIADKLLIMSSFVLLSISNSGARVRIPIWLAILVISRDFLMLLVALLMILTTGIKEFRPTAMGKINTVVQILTVLAVLCANVWRLPLPFVWVPFGATLASTVASGFHYLVLGARQVAEKETGAP